MLAVQNLYPQSLRIYLTVHARPDDLLYPESRSYLLLLVQQRAELSRRILDSLDSTLVVAGEAVSARL